LGKKLQPHLKKITRIKMAGGMVQVVECSLASVRLGVQTPVPPK
jgi:hypothetical protein